MMKLILLFSVVLMAGCKGYSLVDLEQLDRYINESSSSSFHAWYLEKEDSSFYYLKRKTGVASFDYFKLSKEGVTLSVNEELPALLKFSDIKKDADM